MNVIPLLVLVALTACKFAVALLEPPGASLAKVPVALAYTALFASPQLFWLRICVKPFQNTVQGVVAFIAVVAFAYTAMYFGIVPGIQSPSWGGEAHFEAPVGLAVEWAIALLTFILFRSARPASSDA